MTNNFRIAPSVLNADFGQLGESMRRLKAARCEALHMDVMDGRFVPNISFGQAVMANLDAAVPLPMDAHLMVEEPGRFLPEFCAMKRVDAVIVHPEACRHLDRDLQAIRSLGKRAGAALNPATPVESIEWVFDRLDMVLIMTVNPGFGGQSFIEAMLPKIEAARRRVGKSGRRIELGVDGGVNDSTARAAVAAGADYLVVGSYLFKGGLDGIGARVEIVRDVAAGRRPQIVHPPSKGDGC